MTDLADLFATETGRRALANGLVNAFARQRDIVIADLIPMALTFPLADPATGYAKVPGNALARLIGLLECRKCDDFAALSRLADQGADAVARRMTLQTNGTAGTADPSYYWRARHAQTALSSVRDNMRSAAFTRSRLTPATAAEIIARAEKRDMPALIALVGGQRVKTIEPLRLDT